MNDSPPTPPSGPIPGDDAINAAPAAADTSSDTSKGARPFRMPDGAPAGTSARGSLVAPKDETLPLPNAEPDNLATDFEHDWLNQESADGRPIESPYQDETALHHALLSEDMRNSPAYDYPLEPASGHDFSHIDAGHDAPQDNSYDAYMEPPSSVELDIPHEDLTDHQLATATSGGAAPPVVPGSTILDAVDDNAPKNDREMGLMEHLGELRTRIMWCVGAILVAMIATWQFARPLEELIIAPVKTALHQAGQKDGNIIVISPTEGFMLQFNISLIAALVITAPFLLFQIWKFIEPAMTKNERRFTGILVPFSSLLFFMGCGLAYAMSPLFFAFFAMFVPPGTLANWSFAESAVLLAKMLLICGICFQVPVFTIFLNKSGIVSRNVLIEYWRHVVVVIFIVVAILTPTWDPVSLMVCALPPCFLYALSIWLVKWL